MFAGGTVSFDGAAFSGGTVSFAMSVFSGAAVHFGGTQLTGGTVDFRQATGTAPIGLVPADGSPMSAGLLLPPTWSS
ncbi:hypothetical protein AB0M41_44205 [Streptomyces sp. NPDC051896]|uniref:hypothetical protein n=1 Tax=Streptomyces sp. NPDC051896 TaxID=3155416 RepID=UPI003442F354